MVIDAATAVNYLRNNWNTVIDVDRISLIGHSQGCTVAPYVANYVPVKSIVQLMGTGVSLDIIMVKQYQALYELYENGYDICVATNGPYILAFSQLMQITAAGLNQANYWFPLIKNSSLPDYAPTFAGVTAQYWRTTIKWGNFNELYQTMLKVSATTPFLTINSPTDNQVWPEFYRPLHSVVLDFPNSQIKIVQNLCHFLIDNSLTSNQISTEVIQAITNFILQG